MFLYSSNYLCLCLLMMVNLLFLSQAKSQNISAEYDTIEMFGQKLKCYLTDGGYDFKVFEENIKSEEMIKKNDSFWQKKKVKHSEINEILFYAKAVVKDTSCVVTKIRRPSIRYHAYFIIKDSVDVYNIGLSDSNTQELIINGIVIKSCGKLYKKISDLVPKRFRRGVHIVEHISHCCEDYEYKLK